MRLLVTTEDVVALLEQRLSPTDRDDMPDSRWRVGLRAPGIWGATLVETESGRPWVGAWMVVTEEGTIYRFSGNPSVHHPEAVVAVSAEVRALTTRMST
jgi:hypothetical protein